MSRLRKRDGLVVRSLRDRLTIHIVEGHRVSPGAIMEQRPIADRIVDLSNASGILILADGLPVDAVMSMRHRRGRS